MSEVFGPATTALGHTLGAFSTFLPDFHKVRNAEPNDPNMIGDLRQGEISAIVLTVVVGVLVASLVRSKVPFLVAIATSTVMVVLYEYALQTKPNPKIKE